MTVEEKIEIQLMWFAIDMKNGVIKITIEAWETKNIEEMAISRTPATSKIIEIARKLIENEYCVNKIRDETIEAWRKLQLSDNIQDIKKTIDGILK